MRQPLQPRRRTPALGLRFSKWSVLLLAANWVAGFQESAAAGDRRLRVDVALNQADPIASQPKSTPASASLPQIIDHVRAAEKLFSNIEMTIRTEYDNRQFGRYAGPKMDGPSGRTQASQARIVLQDGMTFRQERSILLWNGARAEEMLRVDAFDGQVTRTEAAGANQRRGVSVQPGRVEFDLPRPNTFLYAGWNCPIPFSAFLTAKKLKYGDDTSWRVEPDETIDGLRCVCLRNEISNGGRVAQIAHFWLAIDRGYLPIRVDAFRPVWSSTLPVASNRVTELKEIARGIWIPWRVRQTFYKGPAAKEGKTVVTREINETVESARLNPSYPIKFFRDIQHTEAVDRSK
jgi:hypothetical protein